MRCSIAFPMLASASSGDRTRDCSSALRPRPRGRRCSGHVLLPHLSLARRRPAPDLPHGPRLLEVCMKTYLTKDIRNVGIVGHGGTGKTQLVSSLLFTAGMTP